MIKQEVLEILKHTEQEALCEFVANYAEADERFYENLKTSLLPDDEKETVETDYYRGKAEDCFDFGDSYGGRHRRYNYYEAAYQASSGLNSMLSDASFLIEQGKYADAAAMAVSVAGVIAPNYGRVDDSSGRLGGVFDTAVELLRNIIENTAVPASVKNRIFEWSREEIKKPVYSDYGLDGIQTVFDCCCEQLGDTDEVLADIDRQINKANSDFHRMEAVLRKIRFMQSRKLDTEAVITKYLDVDDVRKIRFRHLADAKSYDEALQLAERGIEIAQQKNHPGTVLNWQKSMYDVYVLQDDKERVLQMAEFLFHHGGWTYPKEEFYNTIKMNTPATDWQETMERLLVAIEKTNYYDSFAARILHEHQLWSRLFALCLKGGVSEMEKYENDLKPHFEKEILERYAEIVEQKALKTDNRAYEEVARLLKRMRIFAGGNERVDRLLEKYRTDYKRRKNMIEALKNV